jgi:aspartyl/asparaginyl-tRNA synthetase
MNISLQRIFVAVCLLIILSVGCGGLMATPIKKILDNPRDYSGKSVTVSGEVTELFSLVVIKYFVVKDRSGEIIVVTQKPLPAKGSKITVKGTVQEAFSLGDKHLIVIMEKE